MPLAGNVHRHARERPEEAAVAIGGGMLTWRELDAQAARLAGGLGAVPPREGAARAICPPGGRLTAILLENGTAFAELFVGATQSPHVCAVLDPKWPPALVADVLRRLEPDLLVVDGAYATKDVQDASSGLVLSTASPEGDGASYESWLSAQDPIEDSPEGADDEPFAIIFTSGTTSTPKAIRRLRRSWRASMSAGAELFGLQPDRPALAPGPLVHGLTHYALAEQLRAGATFHGLPRFDGPSAVAALRDAPIRRLVVVPTMLDAICRAASETSTILGGVDAIVTAGAKLDDDLGARARHIFPRALLIEYYGASELGFVTVAMDGDDGRNAGVGRPFPGVELAIGTRDGLTRAPDVAGTVMVRSPLVSAGYLWDDDGVGFRVEQGWATVGDMGRLDETGALHLLGREGGMILTGGHNVFPGEIEAALLAIPGVDQAVVLGLPDAYLGQVVVAALSGPALEARTASEILALCAGTLPRYKLPRRLFAVRDWPLTRSGKIARGTLETWIVETDARVAPLQP
ncbi:MAG: AMP-binding protein [Salinarimonas sp.]